MQEEITCTDLHGGACRREGQHKPTTSKMMSQTGNAPQWSAFTKHRTGLWDWKLWCLCDKDCEECLYAPFLNPKELPTIPSQHWHVGSLFLVKGLGFPHARTDLAFLIPEQITPLLHTHPYVPQKLRTLFLLQAHGDRWYLPSFFGQLKVDCLCFP